MKSCLIANLAAFAALSCISAVSAADSLPGETIIVTATRTEIPISDATVPVTVITREDIELSLATDLSELLRFEAGIDIGRNGGPGQSTSIFLRGTESNHTLVLIDGVRINPGTLGGAAIQHIAPEIIERIEIVKGARSALFGTDAIGGVINIITRRAENAYAETSVGVGSFDTRSGYVSGGSRGANGEFGITLNWHETDGYAPRTDSDIERGYNNLSANLYASKPFGNNDISIRHWRTEGNVEYLGNDRLDFSLIPVDQDFKNATTAVELNSKLFSKGTGKLIVSFMEDNISQTQFDDFVESNRISLDWQYSHALANHTLTGGLFAVDENAESLSFGQRFDEDTSVRAAFLQDQWSRNRHRTFVALRLTDHETFGNQTTWNAEYAYDINDAWTLNAGLGRAFRAPDATDRFGFGGNADLNPELADEAQFGLRYEPGNGHSVDVELYSNDIEDLIDFDFATFELKNISEAEIRGVQLAYEYRGEHFVVRSEFTKQSAENAITGQRLLRRAEESATISYARDIGAHRIAFSLFASGDREDFGFPEPVNLPGYVLANLHGKFRLSDFWTLNARVENLLDTEYQTAANYRMQERSGFIELKYSWN